MARGIEDRIALVTGGAAGLGQAFAQRLAEDGAHVVIADLQPAEETEALVRQTGREALGCICDVASPGSVASLAAMVERRFGRCDILVNNAGIYPVQPFEEIAFADWRRVMSVNLDGAFLLASAFVPGMRARGFGRLLNVASNTFGMVVDGFTHYVASKGAIIGFTRALASELGPHGITVNAIAPSLTRTPGTLSRPPRGASKDVDYQQVANRQAIKLPQQPADLVGTVSFLASADAGFITGQTLYVDGGLVRA
jgi:NAD(P)-dependent dehydrogenase (short-subunit alcohol dehydrogenase family)